MVALVALMNASNLIIWFYTALKYQAEMFSVHHWSHPVMCGLKASYTLAFFFAWSWPREVIYRYNLFFQSVAEAVIEFIVCKVIFIDYMHSFDDNLGNDDEHLIMFYGSYLMFCLPYKVFGIIVLHSYSQFKLDPPIAEGVDEDRDFVSKM